MDWVTNSWIRKLDSGAVLVGVNYARGESIDGLVNSCIRILESEVRKA